MSKEQKVNLNLLCQKHNTACTHLEETASLVSYLEGRAAQGPYEVVVLHSGLWFPCPPFLRHTERPYSLAHLLPGGVQWVGFARKIKAKWQVWLLGQGGWEHLCFPDLLILHSPTEWLWRRVEPADGGSLRSWMTQRREVPPTAHLPGAFQSRVGCVGSNT